MIHVHKLTAVCETKLKAILYNMNIMIAPLLSVGFTVLMKIVFGQIAEEGMPSVMMGNVLNFGVLFNICMTGMFTTSLSLAEEKEKHTLRTLMTSSVNGAEFFLGSIIPPMIIMILVNLCILPISGMPAETIHIPSYLLVTTLAGLASCILGLVVGIFAKNQASASTLTTPALMILLMVPMFGPMIKSISKVSDFLFTGVVTNMITKWAEGEKESVGIFGIAVLVIETALTAVVFLWIYKKNGFEKE